MELREQDRRLALQSVQRNGHEVDGKEESCNSIITTQYI